jgi:TolB protein
MLKSNGLRRATTIAAGLVLAALLAVVVLWGARPAEAAFPGTNGLIAYTAPYNRFSLFHGIYAIDPKTGDEITLSEGYDDYGPAWSPNGREIAFTRDRDDRLRSWRDREIYVMDPDPSTKDITRITKNNTADESPDWSPSGRKIVFEGYFEGKYGIMVMNKDGSERTAVLKRGGSEPVWSPNGKKIAFTRLIYVGDPGYESHIHVMNKDGSNVEMVSSGDDYAPDWQPIVP